jgi:hypothetical protein
MDRKELNWPQIAEDHGMEMNELQYEMWVAVAVMGVQAIESAPSPEELPGDDAIDGFQFKVIDSEQNRQVHVTVTIHPLENTEAPPIALN